MGSIGYVEYAYAKQNNLTYAKMVNHAGKAVAPTIGGLPGRRGRRRLEPCAEFPRDPDRRSGRQVLADRRLDLHPDADSPQDAVASSEALKFFAWGYKKGSKMASDLDYVPMPDSVVALIEKTWKDKIKGADGKPIFHERSDKHGKRRSQGAFSLFCTGPRRVPCASGPQAA